GEGGLPPPWLDDLQDAAGGPHRRRMAGHRHTAARGQPRAPRLLAPPPPIYPSPGAAMLRGMGTDAYQDPGDLRLFHTGAHSCGYWPERTARDLVLDPRDPRLPHWYPMALGWGFRRSGDILYRPHCAGCRACVAARIP